MLIINNKDYKIISSNIKYVNALYNKEKYYSIIVDMDIELNKEKGYIRFYIDKFKNNNIKNIENKKFIDLPTNLDSKISMIEIFDTEKYIDFIDSEVIVEFNNIIDNKIETKIFINDDNIKLDYQGLVDIIY
ncbi:MAG: hypothetical protein IKH54_01010 [Bacilli bacterium]|nr:hypothetical protein [Bacilli bacterium]